MDLQDLNEFRKWLAPQVQAKAGMSSIKIIYGPFTPQCPDRCIAVQDYPGASGLPNWQGDYRVQIRCRGAKDVEKLSSYNDAHAITDAVFPVVIPPGDVRPVVALTGGHRAVVERVSDPLSLGPDSSGRWEFTINVALKTTRA